MKLRCLGDENQILEAGLRLKAMNEWGGGRSQSGDMCSVILPLSMPVVLHVSVHCMMEKILAL